MSKTRARWTALILLTTGVTFLGACEIMYGLYQVVSTVSAITSAVNAAGATGV